MSDAMVPVIEKHELDAVQNNAGKYLLLFIEKYFQVLSSDPTGQVQNKFTTEQNILLAFGVMDGEVCNGGFIQLIENGYGSYIFDSPLSDHLRLWGAVQIVSIIDEARSIYHQKKEILEREKTLEEFAKLYLEHKEFEPIEDQFNTVIDPERAIIKQYIKSNISLFAKVAD
jgi:hypothetical protein